jgi:hypothetical protein
MGIALTTAIRDINRVGRFSYQPPTRLRSLSVVMPAHNEADNIQMAILNALQAASAVAEAYEVVVVDDGSTDGTALIVEWMARVIGGLIRVIRNERNLGYGPTVRRALAAGQMEWVLFTDSDGQFDLREVAQLVPLTDDADIVTGVRKQRHDRPLRKLNARIFNIATRVFFGTRVSDIDCAFKLIRTSALRRLPLTAGSAMVNAELIYQARQHGLRVAEHAVTHYPRRLGEASGGNPRVILRAVREFFAMRYRFTRPLDKQLQLHTWLVGIVALLVGVATTVWAVAKHTVLAYGDAEAHLNISKRVVSGLTPGFAQLGGVWLPLPHLLMVPFVINDAMWRSGLAGAVVGVPALVLLAVMSYRLAYLLTGRVKTSWLAPLVILANPNTLYLAATPMTEVLLLAMVASSLYFFASWVVKGELRHLVLAGLFGGLASVSRYDGWGLVCIEAVAVLVVALIRHRDRPTTEGLVIVFALPAFSGILAWLLWNELIFSNPLYFANSTFGSSEQQLFFLHHGLLPTFHNLLLSLVYWLEDVRVIAGSLLSALAALGLAALLYTSIRERRLGLLAITAVAMSSFAFYTLSLYTGQASLILPRFAPADSPYHLSNVRYGLQALLPIAIFIAYLAARRPRVLAPLLLALVFGQGLVLVSSGEVMAYKDGTQGLSSQMVSKGPDSPPIEEWLRQNYDGGLVLMDDYRRPIGPVESGVPMQDFIGIGNKPYWLESLDNPGVYATWIVLQQNSTDAVWSGMDKQSRSILVDHFVEVYRSGTIHVYKRRSESSDFVLKQGQHLLLNGQKWKPVGVNSYDLLSQPQQVIDDRLTNLAQGGENTVRTWCFDKDGGVSAATLHKLAVTVDSARTRGLRIICTLGNTLPDYGGQAHFTPFGEDFFTSQTALTRYRDQVRQVLEHRGTNGVRLADNPGILAWDLINEPRNNAGDPQDAVATWVEGMSEYVGSLDQRHLVMVGGEGFGAGYPANPHLAGASGSDFATLCRIASITLCSAHLFPRYLADASNSQQIGQVMQSWRIQADTFDKPVLVEEVGYSLTDGGGLVSRHAFYDNVARAIDDNDIDGALLWNLSGQADESFTLAYGDPDSNRVLGAWSSIIRKT